MDRTLEPEFVGRTYDDFLLRPQRSVVATRSDVSLRTLLTRNIAIHLPVVSANMDSVTGAGMARVMALEGGLGFIHRALSIEAQAAKVREVKRSHGYVVEQPFTLPRTATLREAKEHVDKQGFSALIEETAGSGVLAGLLTARDIPWFDVDETRRVDEFMTPREKLCTGPPEIGLEAAEQLLFDNRVEKLPLTDEQHRIRGLITKRDIILHHHRPNVTTDDKGRLRVGAAIGATGDYLERAAALVEAGVDVVLIDVAHAHSDVMQRAVEGFRDQHPDAPLVCGNVGTFEGARFLVDLGADAIKVGIGPGRGCRTRLETAAGVPQLQAVREAWCAVGEKVPIIADGGVKQDKDIFLALACGASSVMLGSALSGTDEAPGTLIEDPASGQKMKIYRGMTSPQAVFQAHYASDERTAEEAFETPAEGQEMQVPYRGSVVDILGRIHGHLRSAVSYAGTGSLEEARAAIIAEPLRYLIPLSEASRRESYER